MKPTHKVNAVLEEDLSKILDELGFSDLEQSDKKCFFCSEPIKTIQAISAIYIVEGKPRLKCERTECKING